MTENALHKLRRCLRCDGEFVSTGKGNQHCNTCRKWMNDQWEPTKMEIPDSRTGGLTDD